MRNSHRVIAGLALLQTAFCVYGQDSIEFGQNRIGAAVAGAEWTIDKAFPGTKFIFEADYTFGRGDAGSAQPDERDERLLGVLDAHLQWGQGETGLEYYDMKFAAIVRQRTHEIEPGRLDPARDFLEWGTVRLSEDDPLGVDNYAEIGILRLGRAWQKRSLNRPITFTIDLHTSFGWAWAESFDPRYADVSNPYTGVWMHFAMDHDKWGKLYTADRVVSGTSLGSPKDSMSREARIRFGYHRRIAGCFDLDVFVEKRSFNFSDEQMPSLYTKSKRYGAQLQCRFGP